MLLASDTDNLIPLDPSYIKRVAYLHQEPDFKPLIEVEFIEIVNKASRLLASDTECQTREEKSREEKRRVPVALESKKDRSELIEQIARTYPGNKTLDGLMIPHIIEKAIREAVEAHGDAVLAGTKAYAAAVAKFPPHKRQFIPAAERWFAGGKYNTDPAEWVDVKPGEDAPIIFKSAAPRDCAKEAIAELLEDAANCGSSR
jgi:hypothetical protein